MHWCLAPRPGAPDYWELVNTGQALYCMWIDYFFFFFFQ